MHDESNTIITQALAGLLQDVRELIQLCQSDQYDQVHLGIDNALQLVTQQRYLFHEAIGGNQLYAVPGVWENKLFGVLEEFVGVLCFHRNFNGAPLLSDLARGEICLQLGILYLERMQEERNSDERIPEEGT